MSVHIRIHEHSLKINDYNYRTVADTTENAWVYTYDIDELNHGHSKLDFNGVSEVSNGTYERIITFVEEEIVHQPNFVIATQTYTHAHAHITHTHITSEFNIREDCRL